MDDLTDPKYPDRPQHPDFWHLSEIVLEMDGKFQEEGDKTDIEEYVAEEIDLDSLMYMGLQRALRIQGMETGMHAMATLYIEAFLVGRRYERRYGDDR